MSALGDRFGVLASTVLLASAVWAAPRVELRVPRDGVYRVSDAEIRAAGYTFPDGALDRLTLTLRGKPVPIRLVRHNPTTEAGRFELTFVGEFPHGTEAWEDAYNLTSVYVLAEDERAASTRLRLEPLPTPTPGQPSASRARFLDHFELNRKLVRFSDRHQPPDPWFWAEVKANHRQPFTLPAVGVASSEPFTLRIAMHGYSHLPADPDHEIEVSWNGQVVGSATWDGESPHLFEEELSGARLNDGPNELVLQARGKPIDLILLDWVELEYPRRLDLTISPQLPLLPPHRGVYEATGVAAEALIVQSDLGVHRVVAGPDGHVRFELPSGESGSVWLVAEGDEYRPEVEVSHPVDLQVPGLGADFIIITHESLLPAAARLAAQRESEGLRTQVVTVGDIYAAFNHGFQDPEALRTFLIHAWDHWSPRPRYVLLLGDASWDYKRTQVEDADFPDWHWSRRWGNRVPKIPSTPYSDGGENARLLVPTHQWSSFYGHVANDHHFACLEGDDVVPELALGRIPAGSLSEARAVVEKILLYEHAPDAGHQALFISNDQPAFQAGADRLAVQAGRLGFAARCIFPDASEPDNLANTAAIRGALDSGLALVVFNGHGGRFIWQTGPPDLEKNHDLFTLDDLDRLLPSPRLPLVISLTCYSAPFDHPTADSIGEKLLRMPERGALAVVAASWRSMVPIDFARDLLQALAGSGPVRIGDAFLWAQQRVRQEQTLRTFNLLGDPTATFRPPGTPPSEASAELTLRWTTATEVDNYGFYVWRGDSEEGPFRVLNSDPIAGAGTSDLPHDYRFVDRDVVLGQTYYYYLESISLGGVRKQFSPVLGKTCCEQAEPTEP